MLVAGLHGAAAGRLRHRAASRGPRDVSDRARGRDRRPRLARDGDPPHLRVLPATSVPGTSRATRRARPRRPAASRWAAMPSTSPSRRVGLPHLTGSRAGRSLVGRPWPTSHVCDLAYAHPGGDLLFDDVSFRVPAGRHAGVVGANGVGKSTLLRVLTGELPADEGDAIARRARAYMPQDVGHGRRAPSASCCSASRPARCARPASGCSPPSGRWPPATTRPGWSSAPRSASGRSSAATSSRASGTPPAGGSCARGFAEVGDRPAVTLSGGERKRLVLDVLLRLRRRRAAARRARQLPRRPRQARARGADRASKKTILLISPRPRAARGARATRSLTLEGNGAGCTAAPTRPTPEAREERQEQLGDAVKRWKEEEQRLRELVRLFKERARYSPDWAKKADAMETRWKRFADAGPPPAPVADQQIKVRMRGGDSRPARASRSTSVGDRRASCGRSPTRSTSASASA